MNEVLDSLLNISSTQFGLIYFCLICVIKNGFTLEPYTCTVKPVHLMNWTLSTDQEHSAWIEREFEKISRFPPGIRWSWNPGNRIKWNFVGTNKSILRAEFQSGQPDLTV